MKSDLKNINPAPKTLEEAIEVIGHLVKAITELKKENDLLREQLNNNSSNSSLPPSQDLRKRKKIKPKSHRNRGGQPGHKAHQRIQIPLDQVDEVIDCKPAEICSCGGAIRLKDKFQVHQVLEIPLPRFEVKEYRIYKGCCESCYVNYEGKLPTGVSFKGFGIRAQAMVSLLTSKYRLSKRLVRAWFKDVYKMPICLGSVSNIEQTVSQSLERSHEEVRSLVQNAKVIHLDETGHKECNKNGWAWIASTLHHTYFALKRSRGKKIAKELIGNYQDKVIVTDRYSVYSYLPEKNHQICWAHLKRDFQKIADRPDGVGRIGRKLLKAYDRLFGFWKTEYPKDVSLSKKQKKRLRYFKSQMLRWIKEGADCGHDKTMRTCQNILELSGSLWNFFEVKDVPPTNNHAERQLRPLVISKKLTFGTQSDRGSRFMERIFTVVTTCKQQHRDILPFIVDAIQNRLIGEKPPSFIPS